MKRWSPKWSEDERQDGYRGWQIGGAASFEQVVAKSAIVSAGLFVRRDSMKLNSYSSTTAGFTLGIGGEIPFGINAGVSGGVSRAVYDAPQMFFTPDPANPVQRKDWRYQARVYLGLRKVRVLGFSPSVDYTYSQVSTNYPIYASTRHRVEFKLARYF